MEPTRDSVLRNGEVVGCELLACFDLKEGGWLDASTEQLVIQAIAGDADAFCGLVRLHERQALSAAYAVLGDSSSAGDVVQDCFLQAWSKLAGLRDAARFVPWLMQMVRNRAIDRARVKPCAQLNDAIQPQCDALPGDAIEAIELQHRINIALMKLDEITRHAVAMRYFENLPSKEIAERLALSPAAVDMRLSRAREQLREILSDLAVS